MLKKLKHQGGFTLVEMLITLALTSILVGGISIGMSATGPILEGNKVSSQAQVLADTLRTALREELSMATSITGSGNNFTYFSQNFGQNARLLFTNNADGNGRVYVESSAGKFLLLGDASYTDLSVTGSASYSKINGVSITLQVWDSDGRNVYTKDGMPIYPLI